MSTLTNNPIPSNQSEMPPYIIFNLVSLYIALSLEMVFYFQGPEIAEDKSREKPLKSLLYCFRLKNGDHDITEWNAVLQNDQLYVEVKDGELPPGSKEW